MINNLDYVYNQINNIEIISKPWPHAIINNFLPEDLYESIIAELPLIYPFSHCKKAKRKRFTILNDNLSSVSKYKNLTEYQDIICHKKIQNLLICKFENATRKITNYNLKIDPLGMYDITTHGHVYRVHTDRWNKLITIIFYLADKDDDPLLGTRLYSSEKKSKELDWDNDCVKIVPYISNTACIFAPDSQPKQWTNHAMGHNSKQTKYRKTIMHFYRATKM